MLSRLQGKLFIAARLHSEYRGCMTVLAVSLFVCCIILVRPATADIYPGEMTWGTIGSSSSVKIGAGTGGRAQDGYDSYDELATWSSSGWTGGSYHVNGVDGWNGPTAFYGIDNRAPLLRGETKIWMIYIWAGKSAPVADLYTRWISDYTRRDPSVLATLELVQKPEGITSGPEVGIVWTSPPSELILPYYATSNGLDGYGFKFTLSLPIPEPSSLLALGLAASGVGGVALRKRRR